jgi:AraC-like DNA-binding protein
MRRRTELLPDDAYLFEDELMVDGALAATVITCAAWLLELYELEAGELSFISGEEHIHSNAKRFGVFYAPFSIIQPCFKNAKGRLIGIAATEPLPAEFTAAPIMFETTFTASPSGVKQVVEILKAGRNRQRVEANPNASVLSCKAKKLIDENYLINPSIRRIAARLNVSHEHLSRQFKRDFNMSPSDYLRQLRVADAPLLLARGEKIIDVSQNVGYSDLSRFYKQFRQTTKTSPGVCQRLIKP